MALIKGKAFWAFLSKKSKMSGKYTVDLGRLSKAEVEKVEKMGVTVKTDRKADKKDPNFKGRFITCKTDYKPEVFDAKKNALPADVLVGNGSRVIVSCKPYTWQYGGKEGLSMGFKKVQVVDLVEYKEDDEFEEEDGYTYDGEAHEDEDEDEFSDNADEEEFEDDDADEYDEDEDDIED